MVQHRQECWLIGSLICRDTHLDTQYVQVFVRMKLYISPHGFFLFYLPRPPELHAIKEVRILMNTLSLAIHSCSLQCKELSERRVSNLRVCCFAEGKPAGPLCEKATAPPCQIMKEL